MTVKLWYWLTWSGRLRGSRLWWSWWTLVARNDCQRLTQVRYRRGMLLRDRQTPFLMWEDVLHSRAANTQCDYALVVLVQCSKHTQCDYALVHLLHTTLRYTCAQQPTTKTRNSRNVVGLLNRALNAGPSTKPGAPVPAIVRTYPSLTSRTMWLPCPQTNVSNNFSTPAK